MVKLQKYKINLIFFILAVIVLLFTSQCSFLFRISNSADSNMFLMGGKLLLNGRYPYTDFLEYKGILVYILHVFALILFPNSFYGIYLFEVVSAYAFYLYSYKTIKIIESDIEDKLAIGITIIGTTLAYFSVNMTNGDQVEEFALPFIAYFIYQLAKYLYEGKEIENKVYVMIGLHIGILFWSKFLCLIPHFVLFIFFIFYLVKEKKFKDIIKLCFCLLSGFILILLPIGIYFLYTNTFKDMFNLYFYANIFDYHRQEDTDSSLQFFINFIANNKFIMPIYISCLVLSILQCKEKVAIGIMSIVHIIIIFILTMCNAWQYYYLPTFVFIPIELVYLIKKIKPKFHSLVIIVSVVLMLLSYYDHMNYHTFNRSFAKQYEVAKYINETENPKVINMNFEEGYFLASDTLPIDYYFALIERNREIILERYNELISQRACDYVIVKQKGNALHTDIDWSYEKNQHIKNILNSYGYEQIYFCDDIGRDDYAEPYSMVVLYKLQER